MLAEHALEVKLAAGLESEPWVAFGVLLERRGDEDLTARRLVCDSRREHHVAAQQLVWIGDHKARVQAHAKAHSGVGARRERSLQLDAAMQAGVGTVEGGHEPIAFDRHDLTVVMTDDLTYEHVVVVQQLSPLLRAQALSDVIPAT